ncbi:unnamed protein product [Sphagnum compactum]
MTEVKTPDEADIIIWNGGEDIGTEIYNQKPVDYGIPNMKSRRDYDEIKMFEKFRSRSGKLLLGICRGSQLLNCLNGGSLWQDVDGHHRSHPMIDMLTGETVEVTSTHHQQMRPHKKGVVIGLSSKSEHKRAQGEANIVSTSSDLKYGQDVEIVWYPDTHTLCIQGHPEYVPNSRFAQYTLELLNSFDVVRGHHSTGTAVVKRFDSEIEMAKAAVPSPMFIGLKEYQDLMNKASLKVIIGHNRYATIGEKIPQNAHPFKFPNLVGAHNGTIDSWSLRDLEDSGQFGTDSEALYNSISKIGIKSTIEKMTGAWALSWFDKDNNTMNLLRNDKRPLYYTYSDDRETMFWASEATMLEWILKRNRIKLYENSIYECEKDRHYRWILPDKFGEKFEKPVLTIVEGYSYTKSFSKDGGKYSGYHYSDNWKNRNNKNSTSDLGLPAIVTKKPAGKIDTKKFRPPYKDANGHVINKVRFDKITANGCAFCDSNASIWGDFILPMQDDVDGRPLYLCEECYNNDDIRDIVTYAL